MGDQCQRQTIISYSNSCIKELLKAASQAISVMIRLVWPEAMGLATTPQLWKSFHVFLQKTHPTVHLAEVNDDVVGFFFNSVPRQQILDSLFPGLSIFIRPENFHLTSQFPFGSFPTVSLPGQESSGLKVPSTSNTCMFPILSP